MNNQDKNVSPHPAVEGTPILNKMIKLNIHDRQLKVLGEKIKEESEMGRWGGHGSETSLKALKEGRELQAKGTANSGLKTQQGGGQR